MKKEINLKNNVVLNTDKRTSFNVLDSGINFCLSLIIPSVSTLLFIVLGAFVLRLWGSSYENFIGTNVGKVMALMITPIMFFLTYIIYCKSCKIDGFKALNVSSKLNYQKVLIVIIISLVAVFLIAPFITLFDYFCKTVLNYNPPNNLSYTMDNGFRYVVGVIVMAILPAFTEEILFRGIMQRGLMQKFNPHIAIVLTATMFTLVHGSLQQTVFQFILGVVFGYATYYGGNLIYSMIMHFVNNFVVVTVSFAYTINNINVNAPTVYNTVWDYVLPVVLLVVAAAVIVGLMFLMLNINKNKSLENLNATEPVKTKQNQALENDESEQPQKIKNQNNLSSHERLWLISGFVLGTVIWIVSFVIEKIT